MDGIHGSQGPIGKAVVILLLENGFALEADGTDDRCSGGKTCRSHDRQQDEADKNNISRPAGIAWQIVLRRRLHHIPVHSIAGAVHSDPTLGLRSARVNGVSARLGAPPGDFRVDNCNPEHIECSVVNIL